jgi:hypothetical protein
MKLSRALSLVLFFASLSQAQAGVPAFRAQDVDTQIEIGYGVAIADVQGDGKPDILLADKKQFVWYEAPTWTKHVLAENLTEKDNVCIAARDLDGDGKCEIAVGAEWNPGDTVNSGAVFYLVPPADRTQKWEAIKLPNEPVVHRMKWVRSGAKEFVLVVLPLHGRANNKDGEGAGVRVLAYTRLMDPRGEWRTQVLSDDMHKTHNFDVTPRPDDTKREAVVIGGREGLTTAMWEDGKVQTNHTVECSKYQPELPGFGEVRFGKLRPGLQFAAAVEPMHGNTLSVFTIDQKLAPTVSPPRHVLDSTLEEGHALACGDLLGLGRDQIVVGWRGTAQNKLGKVGIKLFVPDDASGTKWTMHLVDDNAMACEDLTLADLNADGKLDIVASGRRTKNVKIYWNESK